MKKTIIVLVSGIVFLSMGLVSISLLDLPENSSLGSLAFILLMAGFWTCIVGVILIFRRNKKSQKRRFLKQDKQTCYKPLNSKFASFMVSFSSALFFGLLTIWIVDIVFGPKEPLYYYFVVPGLFFFSLLFAVENS